MKTFLQEHKSWVILGAIVIVLGLLIYLFFSHRISWEMEATVINVNNGKATTKTTLTFEGWKPNHEGRLHGQFRLDDNSPYRFATQVGGYLVADYLYDHGAPEGILHIHNYLHVCSTNSSTVAHMSMDLENECVIIILKDQPGVYIVASTDPNMSPEDIVAHFETSIAFWEWLYNSTPSNTIDLKMDAYCIGENTGVQFQTTLSIKGAKPVLDGNDPADFTVQMEFGENPRWVFPNLTTPLKVTTIGEAQGAPSTFMLSKVFIYDATTNRNESAWFVLDIENEMALFSIEREEQIYIAASIDETIQPDDIIAHFQAAINMMDK